MNGNDIYKIIQDEFGALSRLFKLTELTIEEAVILSDSTIAQPAVIFKIPGKDL